MDKDFKKIFDKLWDEVHSNISKADKIHRVMDGYQNHLDQMVEEGLMNEHDARMDFYCKTNELLRSVSNAEERMNENAGDESEDSDDEIEWYENPEPERLAEVARLFGEFQRGLRDIGLTAHGNLHIDIAMGSDD